MWVILGRPQQASPRSYMALESRESAQSSDLAFQSPAAPTYKARHHISSLNSLSKPNPGRTTVNILATLTPISPNVPLTLPIQALLFPPCTNLAHYQSLVVAVVPLGDILGERDFVSDARDAVAAAAEEKVKSLLRSFTRANPHACDPGRVNQLAGPDELGPGSRDLAYALGREVEVGFSRVATVFGPFCFSWSCTCYSDCLLCTLEGGGVEQTHRGGRRRREALWRRGRTSQI